jgi:1-deoxy-D-xylulose-5-phosphate synthase
MGAEAATAMAVANLLAATGIEATVVNPRFLQPLDTDLLAAQAATMPVVTIEDHQVESGLAAAVAFALRDQPHRSLRHFGWNRDIVPHGPVGELRTRAGLTPEAIAAKLGRA